MRISNKDIYDKIVKLIDNNQIEHNDLKKHIIQTNGKVKLNRWIGTTALSIVLILLGFLITHISK